jgi:hypothetical protein
MPDVTAWQATFEADGLVQRDGRRLRTTRRWQTAMARAVVRLREHATDDLRVPIASALLDLYGTAMHDESLFEAIRAMLPIEIAELTAAHPRG